MTRTQKDTHMNKFPRPRYRFCWWCSRQLRGRMHLNVRSTDMPMNVAPVIVHIQCAESMRDEGGWEEVVQAA